ncbi:MAG: OB-fold nucleic acid binding domain-containing protein, partial [Ghiorsea sp.]|nr:OB-fold nucleic acid binding domain-containing protein [Ghiorsea sp.]
MTEKTSAPEATPKATSQNKLPEQTRVRRDKLALMRELGQAYPNTWRSNASLLDLHEQHDDADKETLVDQGIEVFVAGRLLAHRVMGKSSFVKIQDKESDIQLFLNRDALGGAEVYNPTKKWDLGDIIGAKGILFFTKTGELSVKVSHVEMITKCLRPLPDKMQGL